MKKSGLEMIEELLEKVNLLDRRFSVVEQNVKELLNRANTTIQKQESQKQEPSIVGSEPSATSMEGLNADVMKATTKTIKVLGKIKNREGKFLIGVNVNIIKENGEVVKETKTNKAGDWISWLPPGKYKARYFMENQINTAVSFMVRPDQTLIRVAQPKWE